MRIRILYILICMISYANAQEGWRQLFNGKDLDNWHVIDGTAEFRVENEMIIGVSRMNTPNTFLATKEQFGDFILEYADLFGLSASSHERGQGGREHSVV